MSDSAFYSDSAPESWINVFGQLTITTAPAPIARYLAELMAAFLLYFAREIDHYRQALRQASNQIYEDLHLTGAGESKP